MTSKDAEIYSLLNSYELDSSGIYKTGPVGYWSNLSKDDNTDLINTIDNDGAEKAVKDNIPHLYDMIYDPKREAALELLTYKDGATCIDFGCMWGVLSIGAAKRFKNVIAIDQTYESLYFLKKRCEEEGIDNIFCMQGDIRNPTFNNIGDFAIANGVLEWIPVNESVEVKKYHKKKRHRKLEQESPKTMQLKFLKVVYDSLLDGGELVLAIENRHSYQYYMGMRDPHSNLLFTTFLPRFMANWISILFRNKEYRNYIYSFNKLSELVKQAGFKEVLLYAAFPNYHFPELILPYSDSGFKEYRSYINKSRVTKKQKIAYFVERILMKLFRARWFSPAIIAIATKKV